MDKQRPKHGEKDCPKDAWKRWKWVRYPGDESHTEDAEHREIRETRERSAERETDRDLKKPIPQLVADFNTVVEHLMEDRNKEKKEEKKEQQMEEKRISQDTIYMLAAQRRLVAMMAEVAISNNRMAWVMLCLTVIIAALTAVLVLKG
ncbi:MAG: hypothetical protein ABSB22_04500 [Thermodesulfobacteriota bacterium]|jgi:hypothetical protein